MAKVAINFSALKATNYRQFLMAVMRADREEIPRGQLSNLARKSGLPRSFITEMLQGKRDLTLRSFSRLQPVLKLPADMNRFFAFLVALESKDFRESKFGLSVDEVKVRLVQLRQRVLQKRSLSPGPNFRRESRILSLEVFCIYASLGSIEHGASFPQILQKTNLDAAKVQRSLSSMIEAGWVRMSDDRFFASDRAIDFHDIGHDLGFVQAFAESSSEMSSTAKKISLKNENLVFFSVIPISPHRAIEFKDRVRSTILDIIDEFQEDEGSEVKKITIGIY